MTIRPKTVESKLAVRTLRGLFITHGFNAFPVVDDGATLLGIVTKVDLLRVFRHDRRRLLPDLAALGAEHVVAGRSRVAGPGCEETPRR